MVARSVTGDLRRLGSLRNAFGAEAAAEKLELLGRLDRANLPSARHVALLHEILCFWRAYPDDEEVLSRVEDLLARFDRRADLRRHRAELVDTGIAGTDLHIRFHWLMALRLARRWPAQLSIDWEDAADAGNLVAMLELLLPYSETPAIDAFDLTPRQWLARLKRPEETDAVFLIRRIGALRVSSAVREYLYGKLGVRIRLAAGADTPARTREKWVPPRIVYQRQPPRSSRPLLRHAVREAEFEVRNLPPGQGRELIDIANAAMVPRHRDLHVFLHADEKDVRLIDFGDELQFACMGARPEGRLVLEAVYGFLTLRNGVPTGYVLNSALFGSCELAFNVFDTFRGSEAARTYARFLATVSRLFGADSFTIDPYQLGHDNKEGLLSGAWWFYYKLGFRPREPELRELALEEVRRIERDRSYRTSLPRLNRLAAGNMFYDLGRRRRDVLGRVWLGNIGLKVSGYLARRFGSDREKGIRTCAVEAARLLGARPPGKLPPGPRLAWDRWAPLVLILPGIESWSRADRAALAKVIRAKGGRRESDFVGLFDRHSRLRAAILELAKEE